MYPDRWTNNATENLSRLDFENDGTEEKQINLGLGDDRITLTMILNNASSW